MRLTSSLLGGGSIACCIIEIVRVPGKELFGNAAEEALQRIDDGTSRALADLARRAPDGTLAIEFLLISTPAANQLYRAQPHLFLILRKLSQDERSAKSAIDEAARDVMSTLSQLGYACASVSGERLDVFEAVLGNVNAERVVALTRDELAFSFANNGMCFYFNEPLPEDPVRNLALLTNTLSEHPGSAFSLALIPTSFTQAEENGIEQRRMCIDALRKQVMMTPGGSTPTSYTDASRAYLDFIQREHDPTFYFLPVVFARPAESDSLVNRLLSIFAGRDNPDTHMLRRVDITGAIQNPAEGFLTRPWTLSDLLVFNYRAQSFWAQPNAPRDLFRLRQIAPFSTVKFFMRPPYDDGRAIGLDVNRNDTAREKLNDAVLSEKSFRIGTITDAGYVGARPGEKAPQAGIPLNDLTKHGMIVGKSGSGKTNFIHTMLIRLARRGIPFLAIEPTKTEYRCLLDAIPDLAVFTPGMNEVSPFIINPFIPPKGVTVESYIPCLLSAFEVAFTMPDPLPAIFREVINKTYNLYGWKMTSTCEDPDVTWFGFHEMIRVFQNHVATMDYEGDVKGNITTAGVLRLSALIEQNANIYDTTKTIPIDELLARSAVLELNAITAKEQKTLLMALLLVEICNYTKFNTAPDSELKNILLIDEAHVLFGAGSSAEGGLNRAAAELEDMIAEIRAYGTGVFVADQSPTTFGPSIIANTDTKIMFQVIEKGSKDTLEAATGLSEAKRDLLGKLRVGECLLYYGRLPEPILVKADDARAIAQFRREIPNQEVHEKVDFWRIHADLLRPFNECERCEACRTQGCDLAMRSTCEYVATKMANFYAPYITSRAALERFLATKAEQTAAAQLAAAKAQGDATQLGFCVMARFLRRILRMKRLDIPAAVYAGYVKDAATHPYTTP